MADQQHRHLADDRDRLESFSVSYGILARSAALMVWLGVVSSSV
jgi:hypothetical protein